MRQNRLPIGKYQVPGPPAGPAGQIASFSAVIPQLTGSTATWQQAIYALAYEAAYVQTRLHARWWAAGQTYLN
jgi:hypothetical protein